MFAVIFDLEGQLDCTLYMSEAEATTEAARLSDKYAIELANYSAAVAVQAVTLPAPATLCNFAPAMLDALRSIARDDDGDAMLDAAGMDRIAALLARIDGAPTAQPAAPISEAGDHCASCGAEEGESHGAQCEARGFAMGAAIKRGEG